MSRRKRILFVALALTLSLLAIEAFLHLACALFPPVDRIFNPWKPPPPRMVHDPLLGLRGNPVHPDIDAKGFRNPDVLGSADIVVLGDSQSWGINADLAQTWPRRLARILDRDVYSMGVGGYSPTHGLLLLSEAVSLSPQLVVYAFYSGNDLIGAQMHAYRTEALASLRLPPEERRKAFGSDRLVSPRIEEYDRYRERQKAATRKLRGFDEAQEVRDDRPASPVSPSRLWLSRHCRLYGLARAVKNGILGKRRADALVIPRDFEEVRAVARLNPDDYILFDEGTIRTGFTPRVRLLAVAGDDPWVREGERIVKLVFERMAKRLEAEGIAFLVLLIPTKETAYRDRVADAGTPVSDDYTSLLREEKRAIVELKRFLREKGIPVLDAAPALQKALARGEPVYPPSWDGHPAPAGYATIARAVAEAIREQGLLDPEDEAKGRGAP